MKIYGIIFLEFLLVFISVVLFVLFIQWIFSYAKDYDLI